MAYLNDRVLDLGLNVLDAECDRLDICTQEPANYTEATSTYTKGFKDHGAAGSAFGAPAAGSHSGRKVSSVAVTDGAVTGSGTASHWAASDVGSTRLLGANTLAANQVVTSGNAWSLASFDVRIPAPGGS
jgi:hypothetical protein